MNTIQTVKTEKMAELKKNSKKGFTLVELVVVIAILAILAVIAIPVVSSTIASSQRSGALSDAQTLELALKEAHAQIAANDSSAGYTSGSTVANVVTNKSLQAIGVSGTATTRDIAGATYTLEWDATDDKCYWICTTAGGGVSAGDNLDANITPGGTPTALLDTATVVSLF